VRRWAGMLLGCLLLVGTGFGARAVPVTAPAAAAVGAPSVLVALPATAAQPVLAPRPDVPLALPADPPGPGPAGPAPAAPGRATAPSPAAVAPAGGRSPPAS
jgi:hypothetical protein